MNDLAVRALALALFVGVLAAGVQAATEVFGRPVEVRLAPAELRLLGGTFAGAPGTTVTFPLLVSHHGAENASLRFGSPGLPLAFAAAPSAIGPGETRGFWASLDLPNGSSGPWRALAQVTVQGGVATLALPVAAAHGPFAQDGDLVTVDYVGRFPNGTMWGSSVRAIADGPFPKWERFQAAQQSLNISLDQSYHIPGLYRALLGMGEGQGKTVTLAPQEGFGAPSQRGEVPRTTAIPRLSDPLPLVQHYPRTFLGQSLDESSAPGDMVVLSDQNGNRNTFVIRDLDATNVTLVWQVRQGDLLTFYRPWPRASVAVNVTDTTVTLRTDPPQGTSFTWPRFEYWPNMTRVRSFNDTAIVLEHDPPPGLVFEYPGAGLVRVVELADEAVRVGHPLGAETVVFDLAVRAVRRG